MNDCIKMPKLPDFNTLFRHPYPKVDSQLEFLPQPQFQQRDQPKRFSP